MNADVANRIASGIRGLYLGISLGVFALATALAATSLAQPVITGPDANGFTWCEVGSPGNAPAKSQEYPNLAFNGVSEIGRVDSTYRVSQNELTRGQQFQFVQAYTRVFPASFDDTRLGGFSIFGLDGQWVTDPSLTNFPGQMSFRYAMQYCNWLHNGRAETPEAMLTGAYNVQEFGVNAPREPGAQYWMTSLDEWTKAMYYDPNKFGPNQAGYWLYQTMSDTPPVGGLPGTPGAQTSAGDYIRDIPQSHPVGSYPNAMSPWGLLDGSGGVIEWTDTLFDLDSRPAKGSTSNSQREYRLFDRLDDFHFLSLNNVLGVRIATVPSVSGWMFAAIGLTFHAIKRRRS